MPGAFLRSRSKGVKDIFGMVQLPQVHPPQQALLVDATDPLPGIRARQTCQRVAEKKLQCSYTSPMDQVISKLHILVVFAPNRCSTTRRWTDALLHRPCAQAHSALNVPFPALQAKLTDRRSRLPTLQDLVHSPTE